LHEQRVLEVGRFDVRHAVRIELHHDGRRHPSFDGTGMLWQRPPDAPIHHCQRRHHDRGNQKLTIFTIRASGEGDIEG